MGPKKRPRGHGDYHDAVSKQTVIRDATFASRAEAAAYFGVSDSAVRHAARVADMVEVTE